MPRSAHHFVLPIVVLFALSGCAGVGMAPPSQPPVESSTPSVTPTPTPEPTRPALDELVMDPGGLGPIRFGEPVPILDPDISPVVWMDDVCVNDESGIVSGGPNSGYWAPAYPEDPQQGAAFSISTMGGVKEGSVFWIFGQAGIRTTEGVQLGSTRAQLEAAYPAFDHVMDAASTRIYALDAGASRLVFEVVTDGAWWPERADQVAIMRVEPTRWELGSIAGSDAGYLCPV